MSILCNICQRCVGNAPAILSRIAHRPLLATVSFNDIHLSQQTFSEDSGGLSETTFQKSNIPMQLITTMPEGMSDEEIRDFYSKYSPETKCQIKQIEAGIKIANVTFSTIEQATRAMADRPHSIEESPLRVKYGGSLKSNLGLSHVNLFVGPLSENTTAKSIHEHFSKFGKPLFWEVRNDGRFDLKRPYGIVSYASQEEVDEALKNGPHTIEGEVVHVKRKKDLKKPAHLWIGTMPAGTSVNALRNFYSKYGKVKNCKIWTGKTGRIHGFVKFASTEEAIKALDDRPHLINESPLEVRCTGSLEITLGPRAFSLLIGFLPESATADSIREYFSKFGKPVYWEVKNDGDLGQKKPYASKVCHSGGNNAINSGPHTIEDEDVEVKMAKEAAGKHITSELLTEAKKFTRENLEMADNALKNGPPTIGSEAVDVKRIKDVIKSFFKFPKF